MRNALLALGLGCLLATTFASSLIAQQPAGYVVVVHASNPVSSLPSAEVMRMFMKQTTKWPNGIAVMPVDQPISSPVREMFSKRVLGRSARSVKSHWSQQIFSGRGVPPAERENDAEVVRFVMSNRGAIGYVSSASAAGAKVLQVR
jgi:ABC-type phosphate transport system substrate-binding protein